MNSEIKDITSDYKKKEIIKNNIKELMNSYWEDNKKELKRYFRGLDPEYKKTVIKELGNLENKILVDYLNNTNTKIIPNNKNIDNTINNNNYITNKNKTIDKDESKIKLSTEIDAKTAILKDIRSKVKRSSSTPNCSSVTSINSEYFIL